MVKLKCITLLLYAAVFSASAMADDNVRDGRPCLSGVCVGDEISTLAGIKWQTARDINGTPVPLRMDDAEVKNLLKNFAPSAANVVVAAAPYLRYHLFDGKVIPTLAKLKGVCKPLDLKGTFISDSGYKTEVDVNVVPGADPSSQSLRVQSISRIFPQSGYTSAQKNDLVKQLEERYRGVKRRGPSDTEPTWSFDVDRLTLLAPIPMLSRGQVNDQLMAYPGCGKSLKID